MTKFWDIFKSHSKVAESTTTTDSVNSISKSQKHMTESPSAICPNCGVTLEKLPQRKSKCKKCKEVIFVKRRPTDKTKRLVTEAEAKIIEAEWEKHNVITYKLPEFGLTEKGFDKEEKYLYKKLGSKPDINNVFLSMLNNKALKTTDLRQKKMIYYEMALITHEAGKYPSTLLAN